MGKFTKSIPQKLMKKIIVAIDGFSGCGKSTTARQVAKELNYTYIDTGAMYRAVTLYFLQKNINITHSEEVVEALQAIHINFGINPENHKSEIMLNDTYVEAKIRMIEVANRVSEVSAVLEVRKFLVRQQQLIGRQKGVVMEGRDIGTVVFPEAELKIFMTAHIDTRTQRRYEELKRQGQRANFSAVKENLAKRDQIDSTRKDSPLSQAPDAIIIDTSNITIAQQVGEIVRLAKSMF